MYSFPVPKRNEVSSRNQKLFDKLQMALDRVPNLYAVLAYSENALETYLTLENSRTSLSKKQLAVINLTVSQVNNCVYCLSKYQLVAKMNGFTPAQMEAIRAGAAPFDPSLDVLARLSRSLTENRGHIKSSLVDEFFALGYTKENLVDVIVAVGDRTISNILHAVTGVPVDFPLAPKLPDPLIVNLQ